MHVEQIIANLEIAVEDDIELNKQGKPAINKLMNLPLLNTSLSKINLQSEFLDHGVLNLLKNWLEPLPDGSLPNINIRTAVLTILNGFSIDLDQENRKEQLVKSGLGKVIMFLSKSDEEITSNRRLANDLVNKWGRLVYNKSTRYADMISEEEHEEQQRILLRRENNNKKMQMLSKPKARVLIDDADIDFESKPKKSKRETMKEIGRARVPTAISMDFVIRPNSKVDKEPCAKMQMDKSGIHENIMYKLQKQKAARKKGLQAFKPSTDGRKMLKYL